MGAVGSEPQELGGWAGGPECRGLDPVPQGVDALPCPQSQPLSLGLEAWRWVFSLTDSCPLTSSGLCDFFLLAFPTQGVGDLGLRPEPDPKANLTSVLHQGPPGLLGDRLCFLLAVATSWEGFRAAPLPVGSPVSIDMPLFHNSLPDLPGALPATAHPPSCLLLARPVKAVACSCDLHFPAPSFHPAHPRPPRPELLWTDTLPSPARLVT